MAVPTDEQMDSMLASPAMQTWLVMANNNYIKEISSIADTISFEMLVKMIRSTEDKSVRLAIDAVVRDHFRLFQATDIQRLINEGEKLNLPRFDPKNPPKDPQTYAAAKLLRGLKAHFIDVKFIEKTPTILNPSGE